ncbi:MAG: DUF4445 domain-containing protein [Desulfobacteraceae bacterium]|nr:DUF4445 domain-containing protein [Desulfobacteraceae bacterium]
MNDDNTSGGGLNKGWVARIRLPEPSLKDNTADVERLIRALRDYVGADMVDVDIDVMRALPQVIRTGDTAIRCVLIKDRSRWLVVHAAADVEIHRLCGTAIDLGTTQVVMRLMDLATGEPMAEVSFNNPQTTVGPDVLARIHHADSKSGGKHLTTLIIDGINAHLESLCRDTGIDPSDVHLVSVAGNTAMTHLFLGLPSRWIIREPYIPASNRPGLLKAVDIGIRAGPSARVVVFPNVGSYFGGDLVAGILYSGLHRSSEVGILVDVGTNAEVVLGNRDWMMACAGAASPALEGGVSKIGMPAGDGVIDRVQAESGNGGFAVSTIGDLPPIGICGSGVIDLAAALFSKGKIDIRGKLNPDACGDRFRTIDGQNHFVLVSGEASETGEDLCFSQTDLDSLVRSKAAMYTILETITGSVGLSQDQLDRFYIAGTFGSLINPVSAITIGMIPDLPLAVYTSLGNSSLEGATLALSSRSALDTIDSIRDGITYLELNVNQDFMNRFSAARFLPHTDRSRFPSVKVQQVFG